MIHLRADSAVDSWVAQWRKGKARRFRPHRKPPGPQVRTDHMSRSSFTTRRAVRIMAVRAESCPAGELTHPTHSLGGRVMSHHPGSCLLPSRSRSGLPGRTRGCPGRCPRSAVLAAQVHARRRKEDQARGRKPDRAVCPAFPRRPAQLRTGAGFAWTTRCVNECRRCHSGAAVFRGRAAAAPGTQASCVLLSQGTRPAKPAHHSRPSACRSTASNPRPRLASSARTTLRQTRAAPCLSSTGTLTTGHACGGCGRTFAMCASAVVLDG
jgi:hypothetical protein